MGKRSWVFLLLLLFISAPSFAYGLTGIKFFRNGDIMYINDYATKDFFKGPGVGSFWSQYDRYVIKDNILLNKSKNQFIKLEPIKTVKIIDVYESTAHWGDKILFLADGLMLQIKTTREIKVNTKCVVLKDRIITPQEELKIIKVLED